MVELFRATEFVTRAALADSNPNTDKYNQSSWAILYGALADSLGLGPDNFQLVYPNIAWTWPVESLGYIGPAAYDAMSTIPQYSAIGKYTSTGERFNDQYLAFLNVIDPDTSDPVLRGKINKAANDLTDATNRYDRTVQQAKAAYNGLVPSGEPSFTVWLGTIEGRGWQSKIDGDFGAVKSAQNVYTSLVGQTNTPNLTEALDAFENEDFWAKLNDPSLSAMPKVPSYSTSSGASDWRDRMERGELPGGAVSMSNSDQAYDFKKSWAGASTSVGNWFWRVQVSGKWERIDMFASDANLSASITFKGVETIGIQASGWYKGVSNLADGPYKRGYSRDTTAVFGRDGFLPMQKTGMMVAAGMSFDISVDKSTFNAFSESFQAATSLGIGPFTFSAEGGHEANNWEASASGSSFSGDSSSTQPQIFGWTVNVLN